MNNLIICIEAEKAHVYFFLQRRDPDDVYWASKSQRFSDTCVVNSTRQKEDMRMLSSESEAGENE